MKPCTATLPRNHRILPFQACQRPRMGNEYARGMPAIITASFHSHSVKKVMCVVKIFMRPYLNFFSRTCGTHLSNLAANTRLVYVRHAVVLAIMEYAMAYTVPRSLPHFFNQASNSLARVILLIAMCLLFRIVHDPGTVFEWRYHACRDVNSTNRKRGRLSHS